MNLDSLIEKGKLHFQSHRGEFFSIANDNDYKNLVKAILVLLELIYQDGRYDALMEFQLGRLEKMKDLSLDRFIKNATYEIMENGVRFKVFGIPYFLTEQELEKVILSLGNFHERVKIIRKEKERLCEGVGQ